MNKLTNTLININFDLDKTIQNISKAIGFKEDGILYLADSYYMLSIDEINDIEKQLEKLDKKENGRQDIDLEDWRYRYNEIEEIILQIKMLQDFYKNM